MSTKTDFTEDEWKLMQKSVMGAGMLVSVADRDFTDSFGEATALAKFLRQQHETSESVFVRDLAAAHGSGFGLTASQQKVETETLDALRSSVTTLTEKSPEDLDAYRQLVLDVATAVAEAKGGVKPAETAVIESIRGALDS